VGGDKIVLQLGKLELTCKFPICCQPERHVAVLRPHVSGIGVQRWASIHPNQRSVGVGQSMIETIGRSLNDQGTTLGLDR
jgi:hypothetical protein